MKKLLRIQVSLDLFIIFVRCSQGAETPTDVAFGTGNVQESESFYQQCDGRSGD